VIGGFCSLDWHILKDLSAEDLIPAWCNWEVVEPLRGGT
jgi:hypothetical protein